MPQPLSRKHPDANISLTPGRLHEQPNLASSACAAIALSSRIDLDLSLLLVHILGVDATAAIAIYDALLTDKLKMQAMRAAAKATLKANQYRVFNAVISVCNAVQRDRHRLAHWIWSNCDCEPNAILLTDPEHLRWRTLEQSKPEKLPNLVNALTYDWAAHHAKRDKLLALNPRRVLVYTQNDLNRVCRDLLDAADALFYFRFYLRPMKWNRLGGPVPTYLSGLQTSAGALRRLNSLRLFQEAYRPSGHSKKRRRRKRRK